MYNSLLLLSFQPEGAFVEDKEDRYCINSQCDCSPNHDPELIRRLDVAICPIEL